MATSDYFGLALFVSIGLLLAIFPKSVISFLTWLDPDNNKRLPPKIFVRIVGILWIALVLGTGVPQAVSRHNAAIAPHGIKP